MLEIAIIGFDIILPKGRDRTIESIDKAPIKRYKNPLKEIILLSISFSSAVMPIIQPLFIFASDVIFLLPSTDLYSIIAAPSFFEVSMACLNCSLLMSEMPSYPLYSG